MTDPQTYSTPWKDERMRTPSTPRGRAAYDHLPPLEAIIRAWTEPGPRPDWHRQAQGEVRRAMPTLAHALDKAARETR